MPGVPGQSGEDTAAFRYLQGHGAICEPIEPGEWSQTPDGANLKELARIAVFEPPHCVPRVPPSVGDRNAQSRRRTEDAGKKSPRTDRPCGSTTCSFIGRASTRTRRCPAVSKLHFYLKKESDLSCSETAALRLRSESDGASVSRARAWRCKPSPSGRGARVPCAKPGLLHQP